MWVLVLFAILIFFGAISLVGLSTIWFGGITALLCFLLVKFRNKYFNIFSRVVGVLSAFIGLILGITGCMTAEDNYSYDWCGICGGNGIFMGDSCFGCDGGVSTSNDLIFSPMTGVGVLLLICGCVVFFVSIATEE